MEGRFRSGRPPPAGAGGVFTRTHTHTCVSTVFSYTAHRKPDSAEADVKSMCLVAQLGFLYAVGMPRFSMYDFSYVVRFSVVVGCPS